MILRDAARDEPIMRVFRRTGLFIIILFFLCGIAHAIPQIRPSILAGSWYPAQEKELLGMINSFLSSANIPQINGTIKAIIVPHAGYMYSGGVAAYSFKAIKGMDIKRVIMIGPCHRPFFYGASVNLQKGYQTPLGIVPVDEAFAKRLIKASGTIHYVPMAHAFEHSLEIELPFLQTVIKDFKIVPILLGEQDIHTCRELARCILRLLKNDPYSKETLILASSDLSHYYSYDEAVQLDHVVLDDVRNMDPDRLNRDFLNGRCEACGRGAIITAIIVARNLGANKAMILKYANSGDVTGDHSRVVGYMSAILIRK